MRTKVPVGFTPQTWYLNHPLRILSTAGKDARDQTTAPQTTAPQRNATAGLPYQERTRWRRHP